MLSLVFGVTVYAASAVLTGFMAGLALGSWAGGRAADRAGRPLRVFAALEIGIAVSALLVPSALDLLTALYAQAYRFAPDAMVPLSIVRFICALAVLLVPTTLMGASLPLVARHVARGDGTAAVRIGWLYAANTAGGIVGTALAGFVLIGAIGVAATTYLAAAANVVAGAGALALARSSHALLGPRAQAPSPASPARTPRTIFAVVLLTGFAGLALEVVWFRLLTLFLPATTYAFTTMLSTVLGGIAAGSALAAARLRRSPDRWRALAWLLVWTGIFVLASMTALAYTYRIGWRTSGMVQACIVAMLPAAMLMGATFPFAAALAIGRGELNVGRNIGALYAVNVCGAVCGSLAGGFLLVPLVGTRGSLVLLAGVYATTGSWLLWAARASRPGLRAGAAAAALFALSAFTLPDIYAAIIARRYEPGERPIFRAEGAQTTVAVHHRPPDRRALYLDGLHQANDEAETVRQHAEIGQLPMALHPSPARVLVVGVGGGVTAGAVAAHRDSSVDVVELSRSVLSALPYFAHVNGNLLERPNVDVRIDDARNFLLLASRRYDVITADLIQPIHAGAGNVYSIEYFTLARRSLHPGGLMMQWIGRRDETHYKLIMRTFLRVFPEATLWSGGELMIGGLEPLRLSRRAFERRLADPPTAAAFAQIGLDSFDTLAGRYTAGPSEMRAFAGEGAVLTDDQPLLEFHRSLEPGEGVVDVSSLRGDVSRHLIE